MNMKKSVALLLSGAMIFSMVACGKDNKKPAETTPTPTATVTAAPTPTDAPSGVTAKEDLASPVVLGTDGKYFAGSIEKAVIGDSNDGTVSYDVYSGVEGKDYTDPAYYTFNDFITDTSTLNWSSLSWETNDDSYVLDYISSGYYNFAMNSTKDGWSVTCELAAELPVDVTSEYVGKYGIIAGDKNKAWKIKLKDNLKWDDGTPITADDFVYSAQQLLDPVQLNRRADSLYAGDFAVYGAKNYLYSGKSAFSPIGVDIAEYLAAGNAEADIYVDLANFWGIAKEDGSTYASVTDDTLIRDPAVEEGQDEDYVSAKYLYENYLCEGAPYQAYSGEYLGVYETFESGYTFDKVGFFKVSDNEIVIVTINPTAGASYYVPYNLSSAYLVKKDLWEQLKKYTDKEGNIVPEGDENAVAFSTTYGTSVETSASFGPYKLTYFEPDKQITFERNDNWFGYSDGQHKGQYQTDRISCQVISKHETQLLAFLNGEIDNVGLQSEDMTKYGSSEYIRYTPESYTTKISFNTDLESCKKRGTQILTNANFRHAYSLALDRATFAKSYTSAGSAGFGMLNYMYVYDPFSGATYRDTDAAKSAIVGLNGLTFGDDGDYDDLQDAYDAVTGYDMTAAKEYMKKAYDECVADGLYKDGDVVEISMEVYQSDDIYVQMFTFLNETLQKVCEGTGFEGKVSLKMVVDPDYYETMYAGNTDMIFTTWGGAAYSPYTLLYECYCDDAKGAGQQMEYGFDTSAIMVKINVDGVDYVDSLQNWALWADASDPKCLIKSADGSSTLKLFNDYDADTKAKFFGLLEKTYMSFYATIPLYYRNTASMVSQKGDYCVTEYVDLIGFGGTQFYTFKYDDTAWEAVKGSLQY